MPLLATQRLFGNGNQRQIQPEDRGVDRRILRPRPPTQLQTEVAAAQQVDVISTPKVRDPRLIASVVIPLGTAPPAGGQLIGTNGNVVLYADSTNATDRVLLVYQDTQGDLTQPLRVMAPGRMRREKRFNFLAATWAVTAGATATLEIYDDPDHVLEIFG